MTALREGRPWSPADSPVSRLAAAAPHDADVFRAELETVLCLALPQEVIARPGMKEKVEQATQHPPPPVPGPDGRQLLQLLTT